MILHGLRGDLANTLHTQHFSSGREINHQIDRIVNTTSGNQSLKDSDTIRREALHHKITYFTTLAAARAACAAHRVGNEYGVTSLQVLHAETNQ